MKVEYRIRPVTRFVVTRCHISERASGVETRGEFDNANVAYDVGYALARAEHERLGYPLGDMRIIYPEMPNIEPKVQTSGPVLPNVKDQFPLRQ